MKRKPLEADAAMTMSTPALFTSKVEKAVAHLDGLQQVMTRDLGGARNGFRSGSWFYS